MQVRSLEDKVVNLQTDNNTNKWFKKSILALKKESVLCALDKDNTNNMKIERMKNRTDK